jgi:hypothetical protein
VLARHNFEGEVAFIGMDDEEDERPPMPVEAQESANDIEMDLMRIRDRLNKQSSSGPPANEEPTKAQGHKILAMSSG